MDEALIAIEKQFAEDKQDAIEALKWMGYRPADLDKLRNNLEDYPDLDENAGFNFTYGCLMTLSKLYWDLSGRDLSWKARLSHDRTQAKGSKTKRSKAPA